ncbi:MAG: GrpB family protein [Actinobacteria bacterium]|nr:GrpB family protein [Actinomycetota bacterium]
MQVPKSLVISDYNPLWPSRFRGIAAELRDRVGDDCLRIDHIGSTSIPGLAAKDLIDVQITVEYLAACDSWPDEVLRGLVCTPDNLVDHIPAGFSTDPTDWAKRYWSRPGELHVHVREAGRPNQRYPLLFRDFLRADAAAAGSYGAMKRALASAVQDDWDTYYAVKDPACDLIMAGAEHWAARVGWSQPASDA